MKNVLSIVACALLCSSLSYAMEKEQNDTKKSHICADCLEVGPCQWQALAANLAAMHTGPVQPEIDSCSARNNESENNDRGQNHASEAGDGTSDTASDGWTDDEDWDQNSWNDGWGDLEDKDKEKKD